MDEENSMNQPAAAVPQDRLEYLVLEAQRRAPLDVAQILIEESDETVGAVLQQLHPAPAYRILLRFPKERRQRIVPLAGDRVGDPWKEAQRYPEDSVGRLMEPAVAIVKPDDTVATAVERLREWVHEALITYAYVTDDDGCLLGVLVMRDLLLANPEDELKTVMLPEPFFLQPDMTVEDAMKEVVYRHYPVYPVCDAKGCLLGIVQGYNLFEQQHFEISAQAGRMVGVQKEEHATTDWHRSFRMRHPWLQINLVTAFVAAFVVSLFEDTIAQVVVLAAFLPVLAGQSGNTGCQSLAVTIRGLTLDEFRPGVFRKVLAKETLLGVCGHVGRRPAGDPRPGGLPRDDRRLRRQRHDRRAGAPDAAAPGRRPGNRIEHFPDDRHGRGQHGVIPVAGQRAGDQLRGRSETRTTARPASC
jgi:magnesium transporter